MSATVLHVIGSPHPIDDLLVLHALLRGGPAAEVASVHPRAARAARELLDRKIIALPQRRRWSLTAAPALRRLLDRRDPDAVCAWGAEAAVAARAAIRDGRPLTVVLDRPVGPVDRRRLSASLGTGAEDVRVVAASDAIAEPLRQRGFDPRFCEVIAPPGTETPASPCDADRGEPLRVATPPDLSPLDTDRACWVMSLLAIVLPEPEHLVLRCDAQIERVRNRYATLAQPVRLIEAATADQWRRELRHCRVMLLADGADRPVIVAAAASAKTAMLAGPRAVAVPWLAAARNDRPFRLAEVALRLARHPQERSRLTRAARQAELFTPDGSATLRHAVGRIAVECIR